jgi:hypothetical protein
MVSASSPMPGKVGLGGLNLFGGLVFGAEPADMSVAFFGGMFGVEGDEAFEDSFIYFIAVSHQLSKG